MLMKQSVPAIQEFCSQHGLYFQLVDLNWGVEKDVKAILGGDREMRQQEIASCQKHSIGPQFVVGRPVVTLNSEYLDWNFSGC